MNNPIKILLVEDNPGDALLIKEALKESSFSEASLFTAACLSDAIKFSDENILFLLLDLGLPDSEGLDTLRNARQHFPDSGLIILTGLEDEKVALEALREGAQNYLNKNEIDNKVLDKTIRFALERHGFVQKLKTVINERIKAEEEVRKLNSSLENRVKQRTEDLEAFTYSVSHDLRSPLRKIIMYSKRLEENFVKNYNEEDNRLLGIIQKNSNKMDRLIVDLLEFSNAGNKEMTRSVIDMTQLTKKIFSELGKTICDKINIKINPVHPALADYSLIHQVMENLISNAVKYSAHSEKPFIEIKSEKKNEELIYSVADNGTGFDMRYIHKLFNVFERLHSSNEFEGTGVGLAIVKRIINKHDGRVWAESELGKGATFYFSLPCDQTINMYKK